MRFSSDRHSARIRRLRGQAPTEPPPNQPTATPAPALVTKPLDAAPPAPIVPASQAEPKILSTHAEKGVLEGAGRVFARKGVAHTTLKDIASAAEMDHEALTRAFRWKEAILERLVSQPLDKSVEELRRIERTELSPAAKLYRAIYLDVLHASNAPEELKAVFRLPEARQSEFVSVTRLRTARLAAYERILEQGQDRGDLRPVHSGFTASLLDGLTQSALTTSSDFDTILPAAQANRIAEFAVRALLNSPRRIQAVREEAGVI